MSTKREELYRIIMALYRPYLLKFPQTKFSEILWARYSVDEANLMTVEQLADLIHMMRINLEKVA